MIAEINLLEVWIPEQMQPGTLFLLEQAGELGKAENPYWAVLACGGSIDSLSTGKLSLA